MGTKPAVLFVCVHNAGRSQMAAGWLKHLAADRIEVWSAGSEPADQLNPLAIEAMREVGIDITGESPKILTTEAVSRAEVVVTMGCGDTCPYFPGKRYEDWQLTDPAGQPIEVVREVRDDIRTRVETLTNELLRRPSVRIEPMTEAHADAVLSIYQAGMDEGNATFETNAPTWSEFDDTKTAGHRFVALNESDVVLGWVAVVPVSDRCVYAGVVEHSVYVSPAARGLGVARALLETLVASTEAAGIWTIQSGIFPENEASIALHRAAGFREVGRRERIGQHNGVWRDVILFERRSERI
ncbi:GNAT family N-acetyltransferase [Jatrophihabitans sp. DSM 45814]